MAYDEGLAHRLRELTEDDRSVSEKKMFGGLCFLVSGNMCFGIVRDELMVRVGPDAYAECLSRPHAREMDFTGRAMKGMVYVAPAGFAEDDDLARWVASGMEFARSLPPKVKDGMARRKSAKKAAKKKPSKKKAAKKVARKKRS